MYAIMKTGGKQYKVGEGNIIKVEKLPAEVGDKITFEEISQSSILYFWYVL